MGRKGSFSGNKSSSRQSSTAYAPKRSPPKTPQQAPPMAQPQAKSPGFFSSMMGTVFTGMAFGAGSEVAHQAVSGMMGSNNQGHQAEGQQQTQPIEQAQTQPTNCQMENTNFVECLKFNSNSISNCQDYLNLLKGCEQKFK